MNKQQRYLSLLLLANVVSGAKAMELDVPNQEEEKDKFALLKPKLSEARIQELYDTMDKVVGDNSLPVLQSAYDAALELEFDMHPDQRVKELVVDRKGLWTLLKKEHATEAAAKAAVHYLSGSEEEQETTDEVAKLGQLVSRVHRRDGHLKAQATRVQALAAQKAGVKAEEEKRSVVLNALLAKKQPLEAKALEHATQAQEVRTAQELNNDKQEAVEQMVKWSKRFVQNEPLLAQVEPELLTPVLKPQLLQEAGKLTVDLEKLVALKAALDIQISPLTEQEQALKDEQAKNLAAQAELDQLMGHVISASGHTQLDREKLLAAFDEKLELTLARKKELAEEIATVQQEIAAAEGDMNKNTLRASLVPKEQALAQAQKTASNIKIARAQADGTYTKFAWLRGYYN